LIEQVNPGGQVWNVRVGRKHHAPYGVFEGMTIFDAGDLPPENYTIG
jgi:hypothetical protein